MTNITEKKILELEMVSEKLIHTCWELSEARQRVSDLEKKGRKLAAICFRLTWENSNNTNPHGGGNEP